LSIEAVHDAHAPPAHAHLHAHLHAHPHGAARSLPQESDWAASPSPLWWSAPQRFGCAAALAAGLWLVILWAVR